MPIIQTRTIRKIGGEKDSVSMGFPREIMGYNGIANHSRITAIYIQFPRSYKTLASAVLRTPMDPRQGKRRRAGAKAQRFK